MIFVTTCVTTIVATRGKKNLFQTIITKKYVIVVETKETKIASNHNEQYI
jgi:hypothetical protein